MAAAVTLPVGAWVEVWLGEAEAVAVGDRAGDPTSVGATELVLPGAVDVKGAVGGWVGGKVSKAVGEATPLGLGEGTPGSSE